MAHALAESSQFYLQSSAARAGDVDETVTAVRQSQAVDNLSVILDTIGDIGRHSPQSKPYLAIISGITTYLYVPLQCSSLFISSPTGSNTPPPTSPPVALHPLPPSPPPRSSLAGGQTCTPSGEWKASLTARARSLRRRPVPLDPLVNTQLRFNLLAAPSNPEARPSTVLQALLPILPSIVGRLCFLLLRLAGQPLGMPGIPCLPFASPPLNTRAIGSHPSSSLERSLIS